MRKLLLGMLASLAVAAPSDAKWREASTDHFVIYSEESEESLRKLATRLEQYDGAMRHLRGLPNASLGPANRLTVYVVSNVRLVQKLSGMKGDFLAGFYVPRASGSIAIIPRRLGSGGRWDMDSENVLLHEYAHHFLFQNYAAAYPAWFSEGYAEFHATARFEDDGGIGLGLPATHRARGLMSGNPLPMERLMAGGFDKLTLDQREAVYGRGWLLTHYMTFEPGRAGQLDKYLQALNSGRAGAEAATEAFGDLDVLEKELDRYLKRRKLSYIKIDPGAIRLGAIASRELGPGEDALMDLKIRSRRGVDREQAQALVLEMRRAAAPFPGDPAVQATLAEAEYDAGNYQEAEAAADRALAASPNAIDALIYKGRALMMMAKGSGDANAWKEVRRWLAAANRADPDDPEPLILFYESFGREGVKPTPNAIAGLAYAYQLAPQDRGLRLQVARQYLADGKAKEARAALVPIAYDPHAGEAGKLVAEIVAQIDTAGAAKALETWRASAAKEAKEGS